MLTPQSRCVTAVLNSDQANFYTLSIKAHAFNGISVDLHLRNSKCLHDNIVQNGKS